MTIIYLIRASRNQKGLITKTRKLESTKFSFLSRFRHNARESLYALNFEKAREFAAAAQKEHATETGRRLLLLTSWLNAEL